MRAVAALVAGRDREDVAELFKVSLKAVDNWWAKWPAGGREALVAQPRGRRAGEHQLLGEAGQQAVPQAVLDVNPLAAWRRSMRPVPRRGWPGTRVRSRLGS
ncbi:helix-turn-helix domain-containing protein [Streptomyces sp. HC307]|uniref:helix-turn-helix domain-containing protein n=1 Tax=Streptomyces flavusporus TaxID=3385496 RepID=UPI003916FB78